LGERTQDHMCEAGAIIVGAVEAAMTLHVGLGWTGIDMRMK
jgi:hypothetical protein